MMWSHRLQVAISSEKEVDLREIAHGMTSEDECEAVSLVREYADHQRRRQKLLDFEEIRRALPWVFEAPLLLKAAISCSVDVAAAHGHHPVRYADAIAASHPMARRCVNKLKVDWAAVGAPCDPGSRDIQLPCDFGQGLDFDEPRFRLQRLIDRTPRSALYEASELDSGGFGQRTAWVNVFKSGLPDPTDAWRRPRLLETDGIAPELERGVAPSGSFYVAGEGTPYRPATDDRANTKAFQDEILQDFVGVAQLLARIHTNGWVHGDISPRNLCVTPKGRLGLIWREPGEHADASDVDAVAYGPCSPGCCMAPEVYQGKPCTPASEVYQLGALLGWVLTGRLSNGTAFNDAMDYLAGDSEQEELSLEELPAAIRSLIRDCINSSPSDRPVSMSVVQDRIERYLAGEPSSRAAPAEVHIAMWARRHYRAAIVAALSLVFVAVSGIMVLNARHRDQAQLVLATASQERQRLLEGHAAQVKDLENRLAEAVAINHGADIKERIADERIQDAKDATKASVMETVSIIRDWQREILAIESTDPVQVLYILSLVETLEVADDDLRNALLEDSTGIAISEADLLWDAGNRTFSTALWHLLAARRLQQGGNQMQAKLYAEKAGEILDQAHGSVLLGIEP